MMSTIQNSEGNTSSDEIHSPIIERAKVASTPVYELSLNRLIALGLSFEDAEALLKE